MLKAVNIKWDTDDHMNMLNDLPTELIIPEWLEEEFDADDSYLEEFSDWLSNETGFCHFGFDVIEV